eukprot:gene4379-5123_t
MVVNLSIEDIFPTIGDGASSESTQRLWVVLNAVTDVIKSKSAPIQPTSYFALLLATLKDNNYKPGQKRDILKLLSMVIPSIIDMVSKIIEADAAAEDVVRPSISLLGHVLTQSEAASWQTADRLKAYSTLLRCALDERSKVRQKALQQVILVLGSTGASTRGTLHKSIATITSGFCHEVFTTVTQATIPRAFYALSIAHELVPILTPSLIASLVDDIIRMTSLGNSNIAPLCFKTISTLFFRTNQLTGAHVQQLIDVLFRFAPSGIDVKSTIAYTELITQAYLHFSKLDTKLCNQHIHNYFHNLVANFSSDKPEITKITMEGFRNVIFECVNEDVISQGVTSFNNKNPVQSPLEKIVATIASGLKLTYKQSHDLILQIVTALFEQLGPNSHPLMNDLLLSMDALNLMPEFRYRQLVHQVLAAALVAMGPRNLLAVLPLNLDAPPNGRERINRGWLLQIMRDNVKCTEIAFFIEYFLPMTKTILTKAGESLSDGKTIEAKNLGILHMQIYELLPGFFTLPTDAETSFKTIARTIGTLLQQEDASLRTVLCVALTTLINRLTESRDAKALTFTLRKRHITMPADKAIAAITAVAPYSRNFLPILFNIFPTSTQEQRGAILEAIEAYVSISDAATLNALFKTLVAKLLEALAAEGIDKKKPSTKDDEAMPAVAKEVVEKQKTKKYYLTDLTLGFVRHLDEENLQVLYKVIKPQLRCSDPGLQKRSFKVLVKICEHHQSFIVQNMNKIKSLLLTNLMTSSANIKKTRLKCLMEIVVSISRGNKEAEDEEMADDDDQEEELVDGEDLEAEEQANGAKKVQKKKAYKVKHGWTQLRTKFIPSVLPEIILCSREMNIRTRETANDLVLEMGNIMCLVAAKLTLPKRGEALEDTVREAQREAVKDYIHMMAAGLASITPQMVAATVIAISRVVHHFRRLVTEELAKPMVNAIIVLMASPHRDVVKAVMGFTRIILACFREESDIVEPHLDVLLGGLAKWAEADKNFFRTMIQILLERLIKRFTYERIHSMVPESFKKVLVHLKRRKDRAERKREEEEKAMNEFIKGVESSTSDRKSVKGSVYGGDDEQDVDIDSDDDSDDDIEEFLFNVKKKANKKEAENNWILEEGDEPINFLDRTAISHIVSKPAPGSKDAKIQREKMGFETNADGKMIIEEVDEEEEEKKRKRRRGPSYVEEVFDENAAEYEQKAGFRATKQKGQLKRDRDRDMDDDSDDDGPQDLKSAFSKRSWGAKTAKSTGLKSTYTSGGAKSVKSVKSDARSMKSTARIDGANARYNRVRGINTNVNLNEIGNDQKKGDVKNNKSKFEPFAYIPLDPKALNKRTWARASIQSSLDEDVKWDYQWYNQTLNHFDAQDTRTFLQRYYVNDAYYNTQKGGPIILYINGEGPNLKFLSSRQALNDLAVFVSDFKAATPNAGEIISIGGSYSGALSAWFRVKYPHITSGSVASSGVVNAILDFTAFDEWVAYSAGDECAAALRLVTADAMTGMFGGEDQEIRELFQAETLTDLGDFFYWLADSMAEGIQYGFHTQLCDPLVAAMNNDESMLKTYANYTLNVWGKNLGTPGEYATLFQQNTTHDINKADRQWWYQTCTEFGYFQNAPDEGSIRSSLVNMTYHRTHCQNVFGKPLFPNTVATNEYYGGNETAGTNIIFLNGSQDPWSRASINVQEYPSEPTATTTCENCGHCVDLRGCPGGCANPNNLAQVRALTLQTIQSWL